MKTKKTNLNLKKVASTDNFEVKASGHDVFIEGFGNKFSVDRGDELIATDAWNLDNFKKNPVILFNHGMDKLGGTPVGKAVEVRPTDEGLFLKVKMSNSKAPDIQMVRDLVQERILRAFSVGFNPKQTENVDMDGKSIRKITEAELFEVSIVGIPMNQDSLFEVSEKSLKTKSIHELKSEILKAKGADKAAQVEEVIGNHDRKSLIDAISLKAGIDKVELLDMLAGNKDISDNIIEIAKAEVKQLDLKETLEAALSSLNGGEDPAAVFDSLLASLEKEKGMMDEEAEEPEEEDSKADGETSEDEESEESGSEGGESSDDSSESSEEAGDSETEDPDAKRKADFQDCVAAKVPMLLEEGMDQDQAVAVAISKCQEDGKCQLTPESKQEVFAACFEAVDAGGSFKFDPSLVYFTGESATIVKQVDESSQETQPPTTPIKTESSPEEFGSPFLDAAKQTNVLLGALISEIQKLAAKFDSLSTQNAVQSEEVPPKESEQTADESSKELEEYSQKAIEALETKLKNLGY